METIKTQYHNQSGRINFDGLSKSAYEFLETIIELKIPFSHGASNFLPFYVKMELMRLGHKINCSIYSRMGAPMGTYVDITGKIGSNVLEFQGCHNTLGGGVTGKAVNTVQLDGTLYVVLTWVNYFQIDVYTQVDHEDIFHRIELVKFPAKIFPIQSETKDNGRTCNGLELSEIENGKTD